MQKITKRLLSLLLSVMMMLTMFPVSAFAADAENGQEFLDSGNEPKHWLQEYQEYVLAQLSASSSGMRKARAATGSPVFSLIT